LLGCAFELLDRRSVWGEERVYFRDDSGRLRRLPAAWTDAGAPNAFVTLSAGRSYFLVEDLLQLVALIERHEAVLKDDEHG
jgi:hypothetical protein